jgi:periplasmic protein TonB
MEAAKILNADILDLLFDGRNKAYGAYNLRKTYNRRITSALLITIGIAAILFLLSFVANSLEDNRRAALEIKELVLENLPQDQDEQRIEPPPPPPPQRLETPRVEMTRFTPPRIVRDDEVNKEDIPPEVADLEDTKIDVINQDGIKDLGIATPPVVDDNKQVVEIPKPNNDDNHIFEKVEIEAQFEGGPGAWSRYLQKNLNSNTPADNGAPPGSYSVIVQFIVDKQGNISEVKSLTNHGYGMEEEAIRAIKKGPRWIPAIQNGNPVNAYRKQPITFVVPEE